MVDATCFADVLPAVIVFGCGLSLTVAPLTATVLGAAPEQFAGVASAVNNDVARTVTLLWFAQIAATSAVERLLLLAVRGFMRRRYLAAYTRQLPIDPVRLRYWEAANVFNAWLQIAELKARGANAPESQLDMVQRLPQDMLNKLRIYFWSCAGQAES